MTNIDPLSLSIIAKAVDFLFDQAAKIMQVHRESRNATIKKKDEQNNVSNKNSILESITNEINTVEIQHCLDQIHSYTKNVHLIERQIANYGGEVAAPINLVNQLNINQSELRKWIYELKRVLESASKQDINIQGL